MAPTHPSTERDDRGGRARSRWDGRRRTAGARSSSSNSTTPTPYTSDAGVAGFTRQLLGGEIAGRADELARLGQVVGAMAEPLGDAEVGQLDGTVAAQQHVARLHIAMDEPGAMGRREGVEQTGDDHHRLGRRERTTVGDDVSQRGPVDDLHHQIQPARLGIGADVIDRNGMGMRKAGTGSRLGQKPTSIGCRHAIERHQLDRHRVARAARRAPRTPGPCRPHPTVGRAGSARRARRRSRSASTSPTDQ